MRKLLQNSIVCHGIGVLGTLILLHAITGFRDNLPLSVVNSFWLVSCAYIATSITIPKITNYLLVDRKYYILPVLTSVYAIAMALILLLRIDYSREVLLYAFSSHLVWMYFSAIFIKGPEKLQLSAINNFDVNSIDSQNKRINLSPLNEPLAMAAVADGLVVDLHNKLTPEQEKFVADCSINNIPVFHSESIREMIEGKVQTCHLSENAIGTLVPSPIYHNIKRVWESVLIILSFPITLPIMFVTSILIKLESPGPVMFIQERVGQGGKVFKIYKFRSMTVKQAGAEDKFATEEQARVTKVGRVIRKVRIDELPQFFNVLKGEMSLIGPRPEQESFVKQFEQEIPFYGYRHMVKPGITGWAQTVQGYADDTDSTREKLAHDLYYIKHLSFWLDMNIVLKTLKTMMTGFGAK
ncbi:exopolysaccharide biosynthesis polyprenyl glycosylphosphotransferase [Vibrio hepatarius]|uniref:UDP-glucose lipid carrier transferase n=1 Tax=Vibrio hepatarius TaxID=171383 RepID=A0A0M0HX86_9VIBR|nr:exopolysaccharide biosynthesis polyprenyl glycosylphosphotransferase [Vibrio hepatarius]KOO06689.1 UDP-glucose lipid carrier transferase [Vibrio hepatarius]